MEELSLLNLRCGAQSRGAFGRRSDVLKMKAKGLSVRNLNYYFFHQEREFSSDQGWEVFVKGIVQNGLDLTPNRPIWHLLEGVCGANLLLTAIRDVPSSEVEEDRACVVCPF